MTDGCSVHSAVHFTCATEAGHGGVGGAGEREGEGEEGAEWRRQMEPGPFFKSLEIEKLLTPFAHSPHLLA